MNIFEVIAEYIWWVLQITTNGVQAFLDGNFYIVAFVINVTQYIAFITAESTLSLFDILKCYYYDFLTFSNELASGTSFVLNTVLNFLSRRAFTIYHFLCCAIDFTNHLLTKIISATNIIMYFLNEISNNILYFLTVIFHAILILLQLGPNLLIFFYESANYCCKQGWNVLISALYSLSENLCLLPFECQKIICNVPLKAYFGLFLFISIFHLRNAIKRYLENFSILICNQGITLWFEILPKTIAKVILFYKKCKKYLISEVTESSPRTAHENSYSRSLHRKILVAFRYLQRPFHFLKVPISRVNEELNEYQLRELQKKLYAEKKRSICVICHDRERSILLYPCRHMCMCEECTTTLQATYQGCPLCRRDIVDTLQVYT